MNRRRSRRASAWSIAILSAVVSSLGWFSESVAQTSQKWEFRGFSSSSGSVSPFVATPFTRNASVSGDGTFTLSGLPCPSSPPGTFDLAGTMRGTVVTVTVVGGACSRVGAAVGGLDAPFPSATRISGDVEIPFGNGLVTLTGRFLGRDPGRPGEQPNNAINVVILTTAMQNRNLNQRLSSLRNGGGGGGSAGGLSFMAKDDAAMLSGGGASADLAKTFGQLGLYAYGQGSFADQETTTQGRGYGFYTLGLLAGADYRLTDNVFVGAAFGYVRTKLDGPVINSAIDSYSLSAYGTYFVRDRFHVEGVLSYGRSGYDLERTDDSRPGVIDKVAARTSGDQLSVSAGGGYLFRAGGLTVGPTGRVTYIRAHIDRYTESGPAASDAAKIPALTVDSVTTSLGAEAMSSIETRWGLVLPLVRAEWEHELKGDTRTIVAPVVGALNLTRTIPGTVPDRDYFNVGASVTMRLRGGILVDVYYNESVGRSGLTNHSLMAGIQFPF